MKIVFYNHTAQVSGAERVLLMSLRRLNRNRFEPVVICPDGALSPLIRELEVSLRTVDSLEARFTWQIAHLCRYLRSFIRLIRQVRRHILEMEPGLIHANSIRAGLVMSAATVGLRVPVIWHLHDMLPHHPLSTAIRLFALASSRNRMLAVSHAVARRFRGVLLRWATGRVPFKVIHNAIEIERFEADRDRRHLLREELSLDGAVPVVGTIGQVTPRKGQLELLNAFCEVLKEQKHALLLIVGKPLFNHDEEYLENLKRTAKALGIEDHVRFLGERNDIPSLAQVFDMLVVNSLEEPFGLVVLEGFASGTPVIGTTVGGIPEIIEHRKNGWLVPSRDERALTAAMLELSSASRLRKQLVERGRQTVQSRFTAGRYMSELEGFYSQNSSLQVGFNAGGLEVGCQTSRTL